MNISSDNVISALFTYAPQFYTTDPTKLTGYLNLYNLVSCQVNAQFLSCCGVSVYAFLMAHYLTIANNPNSGILSNIAEGELSLGYNVAQDMQALNLTPYGRMYIDLVKRTTIGTTVTNLPVQYGGVIQNMPIQCGCYGGNFGYYSPFIGGCCQ